MASQRDFSFLLCAFVLGAVSLQAQSLPVKPGLWQVQIDRESGGHTAAQQAEALKKLKPEQRAQVEALLKQNDVQGNTLKICETKYTLDRANLVNPASPCKTSAVRSTAQTLKAHTSCPTLHRESDDELTFTDSEHYVTRTTTVSQVNGKASTTHSTMTAKWLSADCGSIKPLGSKQ